MDSAIDDETSEKVDEDGASGGVRAGRGRRAAAWAVVVALIGALAVWGLVVRPQQRPSFEVALLPEIPDPCSLVTAAEASEILGAIDEPVERGMGIVPGQKPCALPRPDSLLLAAIVAVGHLDEPGSVVRDDHPLFGGSIETLDALGDHAAWVPRFRVLIVTRGELMVTVQMLEIDRPLEDAKAQAEQLGVLAVARL